MIGLLLLLLLRSNRIDKWKSFKQLRELSDQNKRSNPEKGPWTVPPHDEVFESFMKYCSNRSIRRALFEIYYSRASYVNEHFETNNSIIIKEILEYRFDKILL